MILKKTTMTNSTLELFVTGLSSSGSLLLIWWSRYIRIGEEDSLRFGSGVPVAECGCPGCFVSD